MVNTRKRQADYPFYLFKKSFTSIMSHENKKVLKKSPLYNKKIFLIENKCKAPYSFFIKNIFFDKMDLRLVFSRDDVVQCFR